MHGSDDHVRRQLHLEAAWLALVARRYLPPLRKQNADAVDGVAMLLGRARHFIRTRNLADGRTTLVDCRAVLSTLLDMNVLEADWQRYSRRAKTRQDSSPASIATVELNSCSSVTWYDAWRQKV